MILKTNAVMGYGMAGSWRGSSRDSREPQGIQRMGDILDKTSPGQGGVEQLFVFSLVQADMRSWKHPTIRCQGHRVSWQWAWGEG